MKSNIEATANLSPEEKRELLADLLKKKARAAKTYPLSFAQQRLWFLEQLEPNNSLYNLLTTVHLSGRLDEQVLQRSLNEIIRRHDTLRTTFTLSDGQPAQAIAPELNLTLAVEDLSALPEPEREAEAVRLAGEELKQPFDLAQGPLLRARLLRLSGDEHVALLTMHHIISDGWSMGVLIHELTALYAAFQSGLPSPLPPLPIRYVDYAQWQRKQLTNEVLDAQLSYWKRQLAGAPALLRLPSDRPRPAVRTASGASFRLTLSESLTASLRELSRREGVTLYMTLLAAFQTLLHRYTGEEDIVVGSPVAGRNRSETEPLIGFFVNTLVMRADLSADLRFTELLRHVRAITLDAHAHQDVPFEKLVEALQPERDLSRTPLFQVAFVLQNTPAPDAKLSGLSVRPFDVPGTTAKFDLTLALEEGARSLSGVIEYSADLFEAATIERMAGHFQTLLRSIADNADRRISELPLVSDAECAEVLSRWNRDGAGFSTGECLHELFEQQAARTPAQVAVVFQAQRLTYRQLNERANQLAHRLRRLGVGADTPVGICVERSIEMVVGLLGILKAGGAYVPLDPEYPRERLAYMMEDARPAALLTQRRMEGELPESEAEVLYLDDPWEEFADESVSNLGHTATPDNLAYVIYTSGSTGQPKGVMVSHDNVARLFASTDELFGFNESDVWTLFHSYAFDFSVWELWGGLLYGGHVVIVPYALSRSPEAFRELLSREGVTVLNQTPSAFRQLIRADEAMANLPGLSLRFVIFGGEALELQTLKSWFERHGDAKPQLVNMYGITETTVHVTHRLLKASDLTTATGSRIGQPLPDLQVYILDRHMRLAPIGVPGEMYVGGAGVARGYLNRPELTAERFVVHPFVDDAGARLYKSGDLARRLADGDIEYLGRIDHQVKIRGFRIELGEIEAALSEHSSVADAVVIVREEASGEKRLVAYVVAHAGSEPSAPELRAALKERLPEYMVPQAFVILEELPLTLNGKVDRKALPAPDGLRPQLSGDYVAPRNAVEQALATAWAEVVGVARVGVDDNFFELGGDSIRAIQARAKAQALGVDFSIQQLFQFQTIGELAAVAGTSDETLLPRAKVGAFDLISDADRRKLPANVEDAYPLAMLQAGMLFHSAYHTSDMLYHCVSGATVKAPFDQAKLEAALAALAARHPILRTAFDLSGFSEPLQLVYREVNIPLVVEDLAAFPAHEQEEKIAEGIETERRLKFDWKTAPLLRFRVYRRAAESFHVVWSEHHAILDGWSVAMMLTELVSLYLALHDREASAPASAPAVAYREYVALERRALESAESRQFWQERLEGSTATVLPRWSVLQRNRAVQRGSVTAPLSSQVVKGLRRLASLSGAPLKSVLLAAHLHVLSVLGSSRDVITGVVSNGRPEEADGERVLGLFLNTLPFRFEVNKGMWTELVRQTFEAEREIMPHRRYPMSEVQKSRGNQPLFEAIFNFVNFHVYEELQKQREVEIAGAGTTAETDYPLVANFSFGSSAELLQLDLYYDAAEFSGEQAEAFKEQYLLTLGAMAARPLAFHHHSPLVAPLESERLLRELNRTSADFPRERCVHELFEEQAARTPDHVAVVAKGERITYAELNRRANLLARDLRARGVAPETLVAIRHERSIEMLVGLLAILKAGGAYVPVDPTLPAERVAFILEDTSAPILLTQRHLAANTAPHGVEVLYLDERREPAMEADESNPECMTSAGNLAYVIYTSGSTGRPKGVELQHRGLVNLVTWHRREYELSTETRATQVASQSFDAAVCEIWPYLCAGATLHLGDNETIISASKLWAWLVGESITHCFLPTPLLESLLPLAEASFSDGQVGACTLRYLLTGGDKLHRSPLIRLPFILVNHYGPTENTVASTSCVVEGGSVEAFVSPPIGRPIMNTEAYVLDSHLRPVPVGVAGGLYVAGEGLARGYLRRAALTAERFIPHPFSRVHGARLYDTGDLVRYLPDDRIEFLGRTDEQVKVRGFRIELGEIESVLLTHPTVREVVVLAREDVAGDKRLVAYVVGGESAPGVNELRQHLSEKLPEYMVPQAFVVLEELPLTPNGKVDRKALPAPDKNLVATRRPDREPRNEIEAELAHIWADALGVEHVGMHDNFFELGGHSLILVVILAKVQDAFGVEVPVNTFMTSTQNVEQMAQLIELHRIEDYDEESLAATLENINNLSEEEVRTLLESEG